jgi:hypothetical protein
MLTISPFQQVNSKASAHQRAGGVRPQHDGLAVKHGALYRQEANSARDPAQRDPRLSHPTGFLGVFSGVRTRRAGRKLLQGP